MPIREVKTCERCRKFKRRCDLVRPTCTRCQQARVACSFETQSLPDGSGEHRTSSSASVARQSTTLSPGESGDGTAGSNSSSSGAMHGLISPSSTTDLGDPQPQTLTGLMSVRQPPPPPAPQAGDDREMSNSDSAVADAPSVVAAAALAKGKNGAKRVIRKRKRNWISCLRCHRLKVKCDKALPCGRCTTTGNGRECYYTYNKGPNGGKFPCPTVPTGRAGAGGITESMQATWQVSHESRGASHWRDLMTKVRFVCSATLRFHAAG